MVPHFLGGVTLQTVGHRSFRAKLEALVVSFNSKRMDYQNLLRASSKSDSDCSAVRTRCLNPIQDQAQAPAQMRDPFQTLNQMRTHARPVFELGTHAVAEKSNAVVKIFGFRGRFLVPVLGPFFGSRFWDRPNQFLLSGPKNGNQKMVPKLGPQFAFWAHPDMDKCSTKMRFAATIGCAREQPQAKRFRRAAEAKRPLSRSKRFVISLSSLQKRGERRQRNRRLAIAQR